MASHGGDFLKWSYQMTFRQKVKRAYARVLVIVGDLSTSTYLARMLDNTGPKEVHVFIVGGHKYLNCPEMVKELRGWQGQGKPGFWSHFIDSMPSNTGVLYYSKSKDPQTPEPPIDRTVGVGLSRIDSSEVYRAVVLSSLYRKYQARKIGASSSTWLWVVLVVLGLFALVVILAMSGYFEGGA